jgi:hypothetical protein
MAEARSAAPAGEPSGAWAFFRWLLNALVTVFLAAATVMAFYNVFGVTIEVERLANETACQGQPLGCKAQFTMWERTPWAHTLHMYTPTGTQPVQCKREYILYGTWSCESLDGAVVKEHGDSPASSASAAPSPPAAAAPPRNGKPKTTVSRTAPSATVSP